MSENNAFRAWFVTGTDTGIGKTFASCALIHAARAQGFTALGMKPVASGAESIDGKPINDDAARLLAAGSFDPGLERLNPYCLRTPVSPHLAAREENVHIDPARIRQSFDELAQRCDRLFVEGAGGFLAPLGDELDASRLAHELDLPLILVVGMRLGCINHALLTAEAILSSNLRLEGWIANCLYPDMPYLSDNTKFLRHRLDAPLLGMLHYAPGATPDTLARLITLPCQPVSGAIRSLSMNTENIAEPKEPSLIATTDQEELGEDFSTPNAISQEPSGEELFEARAASEEVPNEEPAEADAAIEETFDEALSETDVVSEEAPDEALFEADADSEEVINKALFEADAINEEALDAELSEIAAASEVAPDKALTVLNPVRQPVEPPDTSLLESSFPESGPPKRKDERPFIILLFATVLAVSAFVIHAIKNDAPTTGTPQTAEITQPEVTPTEPDAATSSLLGDLIEPDTLKLLETEALNDYKTAGEHYQRNDYAIALTWYQKSRSGFEQLLSHYEQSPKSGQHITTGKNLAATYLAIGDVYRSQKKYADALDMFKKALAIYEKEPIDKNLNVATTSNNIAEIHRIRGDHVFALPEYLKAYRILRIASGERHPMARAVKLNLARTYDKLENAMPFGQWLEESLQ